MSFYYLTVVFFFFTGQGYFGKVLVDLVSWRTFFFLLYSCIFFLEGSQWLQEGSGGLSSTSGLAGELTTDKIIKEGGTMIVD